MNLIGQRHVSGLDNNFHFYFVSAYYHVKVQYNIKLPAAGRGHDLGCNNTSASSQTMQLVRVVAVFIAALFGCSIRGAAGTGEWSL